MTVNRHKYFRWTPRTAWLTFAYVVVVPTILGTAGYMTEVSVGVAQMARQVGLTMGRASGRCAASEGVI